MKTSKEVIKILNKISKDSGYNFIFKDVDIDLDGKDFNIKGNLKVKIG